MDRARAGAVRTRRVALGAAPRRRPRAGRGCASSTAGTRSRRRASRSPAGRRSSRSSRRAGRTTPPTSRSSTSGRRYLPRDLRPLLWLATPRGARSSSTRTASRTPAGRASGRTSSTRRSAAPLDVGRPRRLPERVQQAVGRRVPRRAARGRGRSSRTPSTSTRSRRGRCRPGGAGRAARRRPDPGVPARARARDLPPRARRRTRRAAARQRPARLGPGADDRRLGLAGRVDFTGRYAQADAPGVFRRAHVLLHTKVNDPCPTTVIEAMACGVPVVYAASGGTVELVGDEAGVGVPHPDGYERDEPPPPEALAAAVVARARRPRALRGGSAPARAVERFALEPTGSTGTPRSSRSSRVRRARAPCAGRADAPSQRRRVEPRPRPCRAGASETSAPSAGRTSIRATTRAGYRVARGRSRRLRRRGGRARRARPRARRLDGMRHDERRVVLDARARAERADEVVDLLAEDHGVPAPSPSASSNAPTRRTSSRRRKIVCEFARCQTVSRRDRAARGGQRPGDAPSAATARPVSRPRAGSAAKRRATRSSRSGG